MKQYNLVHRNGIDGLQLQTEASIPSLRSATDIRIDIKYLSLNARDLQIATNDYPAPHDVPEGVVPVSDGSGVVEAVGEKVTLFKVGDRVAPVFPQSHYYEEDMALRSLKQGLGGGIDGVAAEFFVCDEADAVRLPSHFSFAEGSTLAVAYTTAWSSLFSHSPKLQPGQTVLCLGTGGVSLCAAQLALIAGARVILTSSSQAKLDRAVTLLSPLLRVGGAADTLQTIDYTAIEDWDVEARRMTGGRGVDFVIEIAGRGTIGRSIRSSCQGALIAVSGYMSTYSHIPDEIYKEDLAKIILYSAANVRGVFVCNREEFKRMSSALEIAGVHPIIGKVFPFEDLQDAYRCLQEGKHFGKVCVEL